MKERTLFNENWLFYDGDIVTPQPVTKPPTYLQSKTEHRLAGPASRNFPDKVEDYTSDGDYEHNLLNWQPVTLPHDCVIHQTPDESKNNAWGFFDYHPVWYRKHMTFTDEDKDKRIVLYFEGIGDLASVYFNGVDMYESREAHTPFEVDLTNYIRFNADNVIAIRLELGTNFGWWYQGGGLYRNIWLEKYDDLAVSRYGVYVHPEKKRGKNWLVPVDVEVRNDAFEDAVATVRVKLQPDGKKEVIAEMKDRVRIPARGEAELHFSAAVTDPALWDIDDPKLYTAVVEVLKGNKILDRTETTFGFREIRFTADKGFFLNGKNVKLQGVCCHGDYGITGLAVADSIYRYKADLLKEMGVNAYRCSHYPQAEYWMDQMDRKGITVMNEARWFTSTPEGLHELKTLIKRDRNHPSVIMWSIGNEEPFFITEQGARIAHTLYAETKKLDNTRPILTANDKAPNIATVYEYSDIVGVNYNVPLLEPLHDAYPDKPMLSTENTSEKTTRGWYDDESLKLFHFPAYDYNSKVSKEDRGYYSSRENMWQFILDRPYIMGGMCWTGFDYRGETYWPGIAENAGATDIFLQKKDAFYQNQAFFTKKPMVHVFPHWNHEGREGEIINVWAYTNCEEVELFLNGKSLGKRSIKPVQHAEWDVPYEAGEIVCVGYVGGKEAARDARRTTGKPVRLKLIPDNAYDIKKGDVLLLSVCCVDENGLEVPDAAPEVTVFTNKSGDLLGTGSSGTDHVPMQSPVRKMWAGRMAIAVKTLDVDEPLKVTVTAEGLCRDSITLKL